MRKLNKKDTAKLQIILAAPAGLVHIPKRLQPYVDKAIKDSNNAVTGTFKDLK
jgi:hypothetical protein